MRVLFHDKDLVLRIHDRALSLHGGLPGIRDENALGSAVQRPDDKAYYEPASTLADLAASLAYGLAKNHAFNDANKRTSFAATSTFLELNGFELREQPEELVRVWVALASDRISEAELAAWIAARTARFPVDEGP